MIFIETDIQKNTDDIHALTRSFYPGEEVRITVQKPAGNDMAHPVIKPENSGKGGKLVYKSCEGAMFEIDVPSDEKDELKRTVYRALSKQTGRTLPWGSLTGIRPVRLVRRRVETGMTDDEIVADMKKCYFTSEEKVRLSLEILKTENKLIESLNNIENDHNGRVDNMESEDSDEPLKNRRYSLYVDVPFCPSRCLYCSFTSNAVGKDRSLVHSYLDVLEREIKESAELTGGRIPDTVYVGGGTPTALDTQELERLLGALSAAFGTDKSLEFTVEAGRPDSIDRSKLEVLKSCGVTRISVNPQTMNQQTLDIIGRRHTVDQVINSFYLARSCGFDNINMDMIIGLSGEGLAEVEHTVSELCKLKPDSLTIHSLALKRASAMREMLEDRYALTARAYYDNAAAGKDGRLISNDAELAEMMMEAACKGARSMGMSPYYLYRQKNMSGNLENTGFAKEGKYGLYNILINEEIQDIVALGAGAISKRVNGEGDIRRCANNKEVRDYIREIDRIMEKKRALWYND